jgi:predicted  nucleic acid-binding Zn-ribbon protein
MSGFACVECGHRFRTVKAAERAAFGADGCPKCGSADIDLRSEAPVASKATSSAETLVAFGPTKPKYG